MSNAWSEHGQDEHSHHPEDDDAVLLEPAMDDVPIEEVNVRRRASKRGLNPRLLALLLAGVVVGGSGFMFMRMKNQSAARAAAIAEQAAPASTEPTHGMQPGAVAPTASFGLLGNEATDPPGGVLLAGSPVAPQSNGAVPVAPIAPSPPVGAQTPDPQVAALQQQISSLSNEMTRALDENNRLQGELNKARQEVKQAPAKASAAPAKAGVTAAPVQSAPKVAPRTVTRRGAAVAAGASTHKRGNSDKDDVITEARDSRLTGMSVRAIYPMNGRDARAWINVDGDVVEVSAGSTVAGAYVKRVNPDAMEVVTDAGVIRAKP